jgi:Resolvase, N terminal domain
MSINGVRAAIYLRVSRDDQTTDNQRLVLEKVAEHRGWSIVQAYEDQGISTITLAGITSHARARKAGMRDPRSTRCSRTRYGDGSMS